MRDMPVRRLLIMGVVCILLATALNQGHDAHAAWFQVGADPVKVAVEIAKPAVVRIYTSVVGRLIVHFPTGDAGFPQNAQGYALTLSGTGVFISSHGDILTADHLITPPAQVFADTAAADVTAYVNERGTYGTPLTVDQVDQALASGQIRSDAVYSSKSSEVYLSTAYTGDLNATTLQTVPAAIHQAVDSVEAESPFSREDVAIVHAPFSDMASVPLGDSSQVQPLDDLTIVGFPGNGDVSDNPTNLLTPSVNKVTVSSLKASDIGVPLTQVGGNVEHGDSGGPALDSGGNIVGIVSFGLSDGSPGETSFLQASNSVRTLVHTLDLNTTPGAFQKEWGRAYTDYTVSTPGHWHKAAREFAKLVATYPLFQAASPYLVNAQTQAKTERVLHTPLPSEDASRTVPSFILLLPTLAWAVGTLALLVLLFFLLRRKPVGFIGKMGMVTLSRARSQAASSFHLRVSRGARLGGASEERPTSLLPGSRTTSGAAERDLQRRPVRTLATRSMIPSPPSASAPVVLRFWSCGHTNRPSARFCRACGKPASPPVLRSVEQ